MRRAGLSLFVVLAGLVLAGTTSCQRPVVLVPGPVDPPPIVQPPPPVVPPVVPPPVVPPPVLPPPASVSAWLARVTIGASMTELVAAVGSQPAAVVPASEAGPQTARWFVDEGTQRYMVFAVFRNGVVADKGASFVEVVR